MNTDNLPALSRYFGSLAAGVGIVEAPGTSPVGDGRLDCVATVPQDGLGRHYARADDNPLI